MGLDRRVGIAKGEPEKAAEGGGELVLPAAGDPRLLALEPAGEVGDLAQSRACGPRRAARAATSATSIAPELPSPLPGGASDRVTRVQGAGAKQPQSRAEQRQRPVAHRARPASSSSSAWPRSFETSR